MKIVTPPIVVQEGESFEQDVLGRSEFGQALLNLVTRSNDELVISLDGQWGEGKTTFVQMWKGMLANEGVPAVYIDAFANDYVDDAFIAVAGAITAFVEENTEKSDLEKAQEFEEKAKAVGTQLLSWTARVGIKAATLGAIKDSDLDELKDIKSDVAKGLSNLVGDYVGERLASHTKDLESLQAFKELLSEIPALLSPDGDKPLVIIIDELDRCKPTYAVELVEKIKHLFSVKNVVFVLVIHKAQLEKAVECVYGEGIDAHTYLQKFINIETTIPKKTKDSHDNDLGQYNKQLFKLHQLETWGDDRKLLESLEALAKHFNLTLRQMERAYTNLAVFYASSNINHLRSVPILSFLSIIKTVNPSIYSALLDNGITYQDLYRKTATPSQELEERGKLRIQRVYLWLQFCLMTDEEFQRQNAKDPFRGFNQLAWDHGLERQEVIPFFIQRLSMFTVK